MVEFLSINEKKVLYGLVSLPRETDKEIARALGIKYSTFNTVRQRLYERGMFNPIKIPALHRLGCEMMAMVYTSFNPVLPAEERAEETREKIEIFDEMIHSVGEIHRGFSLSFSETYTNLCRINDIRMDFFGEKNLLEEEHPIEVIFPFALSRIPRFFDYSKFLKVHFKMDKILKGLPENSPIRNPPSVAEIFENTDPIKLTNAEKKVLLTAIRNPSYNYAKIAQETNMSRHTVSAAHRKLETNALITPINVPNLKKLGIEIITLSHIRLSPKSGKVRYKIQSEIAKSPYVVFMAAREFEIITVSVHKNYDYFKSEKWNVLRLLKENDVSGETQINRLFSVNKLITIKKITFAPLIEKLLK